jgi:hypothetical protein
MEGVTKVATAYNKNCIGCKRFERDVMVSFMMDKEFCDIFLTTEQAKYLVKRINEVLKRNEEEA